MTSTKKIDKSNIEDILALTPLQDGMLYQYLINSESDQYFEQLSLSLYGELDIGNMEKAWKYVIKNNQMLRTVFRWESLEKPIQIILKDLDIPFVLVDYSGQNGINSTELLERARQNDRSQKIDISSNPLRVTICKIGKNEHEIIISNHHIIYDGWSNGIILKELFYAYNELCSGREPVKNPKNSYKEFVKYIQKKDKSKQESFWKEHLEGFDTKTLLPVDNKKQVEIRASKANNYRLSSEISKKVFNYSKKYDITLAALLYSAWGTMLYKYNNNNDIIFGTTLSGRNPEINGIENMVGLFINTIPLRITFSEDECIRDFLKRIDSSARQRMEYECTQLADIKKYCGISGKGELFDSIVVVENYPLDSQLRAINNNLSIFGYSNFEMTNFDLTTVISTFEEEIDIKLAYNSEIFEESTIERMGNHFANIVNELVSKSNLKVADVQMLSGNEIDKLIHKFNSTGYDYPKSKSIPMLFEEQVAKTPDNPALVFKDNSMTYKELNEAANRIGWYLHKRNIGKDDIIGVIAERSFEMIIGIYGILKAGAAYVPIDPDYPQHRIDYLLKSSNTKVLLTQRKFINSLKTGQTEVVVIEDILEDISLSHENLNINYCHDQLIYVLYTSGSTGNPKGAMIKSHAFVNLVNWFTTEFKIDDESKILLIAPISFDLAQKNLYSALIKGGTLVLFEPGLFDYNCMSETIQKHKINIVNCSPSAFYPLVDFNINLDFKRLESVNMVFLGGEPINLVKLMPWIKSPYFNGEIINTYGPTECTDISSFYRLDNKKIESYSTVPIGKPIHNVQTYVLDKNLNPLPIGVAGELCIGGISLARGYYNDIELTKEKFLEFPAKEGDLIYKTGDIVKWTSDGNIEFLGRLDYQVKVRGVRIELGEIEAKLLKCDNIKEAVVIDKKDENNNIYLCAYLVSEEDLGISEVKNQIRNELPEYMVPSVYVKLDKLPLTPNGKINRKELPEPNKKEDCNVKLSLPQNAVEEKMVGIWRKVLGKEFIGTNENFFEAGGNSILLVQMHALIEKTFEGRVKITDLFSYPTISKLAEFLEENLNAKNYEFELLSLPGHYFFISGSNMENSDLNFKIHGDMYAKLKKAAEIEGIDLFKISLGIFIYLLSELSEKSRIPVHIGDEISDRLKYFCMDISSISNFSALFKALYNELGESSKHTVYSISSIKDSSTKEEGHLISPLFIKKYCLPEKKSMARYYDMVCEMEEFKDAIYYTWYFNCERLSKNKIRNVVERYIELVEMLADSY
jgi:amino acid adenylation domain-containing protein